MKTLFITLLLVAAGMIPREVWAQQRSKTTQRTSTTSKSTSKKSAKTTTAASSKEPAKDATKNKEKEKDANFITTREIVGVWQEKTAQMADAWLACLQFYKDGKFAYHRSQYEDLNPFLSIYGQYRIKGNMLYLKVKYRREWRAGDLISPSPGLQPGIFVLDGGKAVTVPQQDSTREIAVALGKCDVNSASPCILFNRDSYFRVSPNPGYYK